MSSTRLSRRLLRRVLEIGFKKVLSRAFRRCVAVGFRVLKRVLRRALRRELKKSKKGLSRRHLEGRNTQEIGIVIQGALKGTNLRGRTEPKRSFFADFR